MHSLLDSLDFSVYPRQLIPSFFYLTLFVGKSHIQFLSEPLKLPGYQRHIVLQRSQFIVSLSGKGYCGFHVPLHVETHLHYNGWDVVPLVNIVIYSLIPERIFNYCFS
jgi:hypothetical protein